MDEEITISHTAIEQELVERIEESSIDEVRANFADFMRTSLEDDPNTQWEVAA